MTDPALVPTRETIEHIFSAKDCGEKCRYVTRGSLSGGVAPKSVENASMDTTRREFLR